MKAKTIIEINSRGNLQREMEIKRDSYLAAVKKQLVKIEKIAGVEDK